MSEDTLSVVMGLLSETSVIVHKLTDEDVVEYPKYWRDLVAKRRGYVIITPKYDHQIVFTKHAFVCFNGGLVSHSIIPTILAELERRCHLLQHKRGSVGVEL